MNPLAIELNAVLKDTAAARLFSPMGERCYFPRGIIAQSNEAKKSAYTANATIGIARSEGSPLILSAVRESVPELLADQIVSYAPTAGVEELRAEWKKQMLKKNPLLAPDGISLPVVVPGLTAGLSLMVDMFLPHGALMLASDPCWDNYSLIIEERRGGVMKSFPFFGEGPGLDLEAIRAELRKEAAKGAVRIILNFPNNPSGYSPSKAEAEALAAMFLEAASGGADVLVLCDDSYFGLFYEDTIFRESLFSLLANLHEKILAVKIDGPIKEDYVWGMRIGFVTFGSKGLRGGHYDALVAKLMGAIRSSVSCANTPAQYIILKSINDRRTADEKIKFQKLMQERYNAVKAFIAARPVNPALVPLPFNSGYFMSFRCSGISAAALRRELLERHGIGVVSLGEGCLRIAFSGIDAEKIPLIYQKIYETAEALAAKSTTPP